MSDSNTSQAAWKQIVTPPKTSYDQFYDLNYIHHDQLSNVERIDFEVLSSRNNK